MDIYIVMIVWTALIAGATQGVKAIGKSAGFRDANWFVRVLPIIPFLFGAVSGIWVFPAVALQLELDELSKMPFYVYLMLGFGAGAIAGQSWKIVTQTIKGSDLRIDK